MHRPSLIIRRFGDLSFGLGFVEDGVWVDHSVAVARGDDLLDGASPADRDAIGAFHAWFACCSAGALVDTEAVESPTLVAIAGSASS